MWSFLVPFFTETPEAPLILPDSVQKANLAEAVNKIIHLDVGDMLRSLLSESVWILVKILIALAIYFIGRWIVRRIVRLLDAAFERRQVTEKDPGPDQSTTFRLRQSDPGLDIQVERPY